MYCDMDGWHVLVKDISGVGELKLHQVRLCLAAPSFKFAFGRKTTNFLSRQLVASSQVIAQAAGTKMRESKLSGRQFLDELLKITPMRCWHAQCHDVQCVTMLPSLNSPSEWFSHLPCSLGGGKTVISLLDLVPVRCIHEVGELLDSYDFTH